MSDLAKNPVENRILDLMRTYGDPMDEMTFVNVRTKEDLDRIATMVHIDPSTYSGQEAAAVVFVKGAVIYGLMDQNERNSFMATLHRVWRPGSRFTGAVTNAVADRVAGIQSSMAWEDLPNPLFVKEYAAIVLTAQLIGVATDSVGIVGAAAGGIAAVNGALRGASGPQIFDAKQLGSTLSRLGIDGAKALKISPWIGAGVALTSFTVEKLVERSMDQGKDEAQKRLDGKAAHYQMTEEFFDTELRKYGLARDTGAVK